MNTGKRYKTRQRKLIENILSEHRGECLTVKEILTALGSSGESVGEATVYRALERMCADGAVKKYESGKSPCAYRLESGPDCLSHFHLMCSGCGELVHLDCDLMREIERHMRERHRFSLDSGKTVLYGLCEKCANGKTSADREPESCGGHSPRR